MQSVSLQVVAEEHLELARAASSGRSARTIHGGQGRALRETVIALLAGHELSEHDSPGEATLQVVRGRVRLSSGPESWEGADGDHLVIPPDRHTLLAVDDAVVLLTVVKPLA